jgi:hypothetical protein
VIILAKIISLPRFNKYSGVQVYKTCQDVYTMTSAMRMPTLLKKADLLVTGVLKDYFIYYLLAGYLSFNPLMLNPPF